VVEKNSFEAHPNGTYYYADSFDRHSNKVAGALLGGAVADALGWPTEFIKTADQAQRLFGKQEVADFHLWEKRTGGRFNTYVDHIRPGEYSDDTQLTLSVARSILPEGSFDADRFSKVELAHWLNYARGAGATLTRAARAITRRGASWDNNFFSYESLGRTSDYTNAGANGAAMRVSPHAMANAHDERTALSGIWRDTVVTHGHPRALWGALLYGKALLVLFNWSGAGVAEFLDSLENFVEKVDLVELNGGMDSWLIRWQERTGRPFSDAFEDTRHEVSDFLSQIREAPQRPLEETLRNLGCFSAATRGSGTATVAAALAIFARYGGNYERAVLKAVNMFGSDTDTIAAMTGSMIGVLGGQEGIPELWANRMQDYRYFIRTAEAMTRISMREATANDLLVDHGRYEVERQDRDIVLLTRNREVQKGLRVMHPVFGLGWVEEVRSQVIRRQGGGTMLLARVVFDVGQSCVFRAYQGASKK
jgi:ADP-ribosylglycohydrolase